MILRKTTLSIVIGFLGFWGTAACQTGEAPGSGPNPEIQAPDTPDGRSFTQIMTYAREENLHKRSLGQIMQSVGERFLGEPYVGGLLDEPDEEQLIVSFNAFDCVLYVETVLALSHGIAAEDYTYDGFLNRMEAQRYRGGEMNGYCSRLHYFSEWIADNERRGNVVNISEAIGGRKLEKELRFMTENRSAYRRISADDGIYGCISNMEAALADLEIFYIPQDEIASVYDRLQSGDIVALATDIDGLDVTHTGLVYKGNDGRTSLMHASLAGDVRIDRDLQAYVQGNRRQIGIIVARPVDHR